MGADQFIAGVRRHLSGLDDRTAQDETDFVLLGGTIERKHVVNANCSDCFGAGWVCSCHGISLTVCGLRPIEHCGCVREVVTALDNGHAETPEASHQNGSEGVR